MWTKISSAVDNRHKFKYMIAFRPYLFSPQYLSMLVASFVRISNNRLVLNLVHGVHGPNAFKGLMIGDEIKDAKFRRNYAIEFMQKFLHETNVDEGYDVPEILVSGESDESIELAKQTSNVIALYYDSFIKDPERFTSKNFKKIFIFLSILPGKTDEEAEERFKAIPEEDAKIIHSYLYGSKETIVKRLLELEKLGITDILFSQHGFTNDAKEVHELLAELTRDGILS